jgi:hypothetical protein
MLLRSSPLCRRASTLVQAALVYPVAIMLTVGVVIVGMGIYQYQQVAALAREGARWASVHGGQWAAEKNSGTLTTQSDVKTAILAYAAGLDTSQFTSSNPSVSWANSSQVPTYDDASGNVAYNTVTVTVSYNWIPVAYFGSATLKLSSQSVMVIQY